MQDLINSIADLMEEEALELTRKYLEAGRPGKDVFGAYQKAMAEIGARFERKEYFVPELVLSGELMQAGSELIKPHLTGEAGGDEKKLGKALIATVEGDIHDIGKNIAALMMDIAGLEVRDLGVDIPARVIVNEAKNWRPDIIGLSGLLTLAYDPMKEVVEALKEAGLRDQVKVIIGGGQTTEQVRQYVGADVFATDAMVNVSCAQKWLGGKQNV
jgi:5-methyltetrahydrofolate--homocysteine methyltransferase